MKSKIEFPNRNTKFLLRDFFQTDVDDFHDGKFLFIAAKEINVEKNTYLIDKTKWIANKGWVISVYCYTDSNYIKILVCDYESMPWENHYRIEDNLCVANKCDDYGTSKIEDFLEWMEYV